MAGGGTAAPLRVLRGRLALSPQSPFAINPIAGNAFKHIVKFRYKIRPSTIPRYPSETPNLSMPTELDIEAILKALSNPVRREILAWLKTPDVHFPNQTLPYEHGVCAGQIDARCGLSQSTVSAHLATLQRAGLVTSTRIGQWAFFQRNEAVIDAFHDALRREL